jgi:hypothetical protein
VTDPAGRQHALVVERRPLFGARVLIDRRRVERFDQTPEADRYVATIAGHVLTVAIPRVTHDPPSLSVDGKMVLGADAVLTAAVEDSAASAVSGQDLVRFQLQQRRASGGSWFFWIGGASILNSILSASGTEWGLAVGLGVTYLIDGFAEALSETVGTPIYAFVLDVLVASVFLYIGRAARRGKVGWYAVGIGLYALDGALFVMVEDVLGMVVHAIAIFGLVSGWRAARALKRTEAPAPALVG